MLQICENIKQARLSTGMSQGEFAGKLGKKRSTYAEWEAKIIPDIEMIKKIAALANTTLAKLLEEHIPEAPKELPWQIIDRLSKGIENITEANLLLAKKLSSDESGPVSSHVQEEQTGTYLEDVKLSGKIKHGLKNKRGILKHVGK